MYRKFAIVTILFFSLMLVADAHAALIGSTATGSLSFSGGIINYFDPANGFVPTSGYLNSAGPTVTLSATNIEYGFQDGSNTDYADFSNTQLHIQDSTTANTGSTNNAFTMSFTDSAFAGQPVSLVSSNFTAPFTSTLVGNTLTINIPAFQVSPSTSYNAFFNIGTGVPEPASASLLLGSLCVLRRRRR